MEDMTQTFLRAYDEHADALFRHCYFKINDRERARDILQDTFTKTWGYMAQGNEINNLKAFLYRTLNNLIIDEYRKKKETSLDEMHEAGFDPKADDPTSAERRFDAERAILLLNEIDEPYKSALVMRYINELDISEIAEITGESENTVSVHVHRGIKKLKELFNEYE